MLMDRHISARLLSCPTLVECLDQGVKPWDQYLDTAVRRHAWFFIVQVSVAVILRIWAPMITGSKLGPFIFTKSSILFWALRKTALRSATPYNSTPWKTGQDFGSVIEIYSSVEHASERQLLVPVSARQVVARKDINFHAHKIKTYQPSLPTNFFHPQAISYSEKSLLFVSLTHKKVLRAITLLLLCLLFPFSCAFCFMNL